MTEATHLLDSEEHDAYDYGHHFVLFDADAHEIVEASNAKSFMKECIPYLSFKEIAELASVLEEYTDENAVPQLCNETDCDCQHCTRQQLGLCNGQEDEDDDDLPAEDDTADEPETIIS